MNRRSTILLLASGAIALALIPWATRIPIKLTYNPSPSAPIGHYRITENAAVKRGTYVLVPTPPGFREMAAQRHYLPANVPLIKRVVGVSGDTICRHGEAVFVNGTHVATALKHDRQGRPLPVWAGCLTLQPGEFFAVMDMKFSFDGRYFGPLKTKDVIGGATPMFTQSQRVP